MREGLCGRSTAKKDEVPVLRRERRIRCEAALEEAARTSTLPQEGTAEKARPSDRFGGRGQIRREKEERK